MYYFELLNRLPHFCIQIDIDNFFLKQNFARASSYVTDFNTRNKLLTQKLLKQGYRYHKLRKTFSKFYRQYYDLIYKFQVALPNTNTNSLFTQDYNVTSMRFIILHTYFTFATTTKWRVDFRRREKEKEKNGNVGFSSILRRTIFH